MWRLRWTETSDANMARVQRVWSDVLQLWRDSQAAAAASAAAVSPRGAPASSGNGDAKSAPDAVTNPLIERAAGGDGEQNALGDRDANGASASAPNRVPPEERSKEERARATGARPAAAYPPLFSTLLKIYRGGLLGSQLLMFLSLMFLFANPMLLWCELLSSAFLCVCQCSAVL